MTQQPRHCHECGAIQQSKPRSLPDHNRLFAVIDAAFSQWNLSHEFQPDSPAHLRAWLQCKAGHYESTPIYLDDLENAPQDKRDIIIRVASSVAEAAIKAALAKGNYAFTRISGEAIAVFRPKSIAWAKLSQSEFAPIREAIEAEIESAIGVPAEQLLNERAA